MVIVITIMMIVLMIMLLAFSLKQWPVPGLNLEIKQVEPKDLSKYYL